MRSLQASGDGRLAQLVSHVRTPLFGSAYALTLSSAATSGLGIVYWTLAARLYDPEQVGVNAAAISAMTFISYLAQLNMAGVLSRFIPGAGAATRRLIAMAYLVAAAVSAVGATIFVVWIAGLMGLGSILTVDPRLGGWFVAATVAWSVFAIEDGALTGLRRTVWVPIENSTFGILKIALLVVFAAGFAGYGVFASWTIPAAILVVPVNWLIFRRLIPASKLASRPVATTGAEPGRELPAALPQGIVRYLAGDYVGSLFYAGTIGLLPLIVVRLVGPSDGAYFYIAWTIAYSLYLTSVNMATSLMVEGAARRESLAESARRMLRLLAVVQVGLSAVVLVGAPLILAIFNTDYATEATGLLRILALAALPHGANVIYLAIARVRRQIGRILAIQGTLAVIALASSVPLLGSLGIAGAGLAWLVAQAAVAAVLVPTQLLPLWRSATAGPPAAAPGDLAFAAAIAAGAAVPAAGPVTTAASLEDDPSASVGGTDELRESVTDRPLDVEAVASLGALPIGQSPAVVASEPGLLGRCFAELDRAGVGWCLLRGSPDDLARGARDVDLLVAAADLPRLDDLFAGLGLLRVPGFGRGPAAFYVGRDGATGAWVHVDVGAEVVFGRFGELRTGVERECLARSLRTDGLARPRPADAFWLLVLHCALEKGFVAERHRARLTGLLDEATSADGPVARLVASLLPPATGLEDVRGLVRAEDWDGMVALGPHMTRRLRRRNGVGAPARALARISARGIGIVRLLGRRWGVSVALLGPDGAGKTTLAAAIASDFGLPSRIVYMGMWSQTQRGVAGRVPGLAIVARPFAAARKALVAEYHRALGRLVIFDRYTYDAFIPPRGRLVMLKRPYLWLLAHAAPAPQLVVVLDVPGDLLYARKGEFDPVRLEADRQVFRALAERLPGATVVDGSRPLEETRSVVTELIWRRYLRGAGRG